MANKDKSKDDILNNKDYSEIIITGEDNCFYLCLSMYIEYNENNYAYYRDLIYKYVHKNKNLLKEFFEHLDNETEQDYENRYNHFLNEIKIDGNYAGDFEISATSFALNKEIIIYRRNINGFKFINNFTNNNYNNQEKIYLIFKNNNHFNIIMNNNINIHANIHIDKKAEDELHKNLEKNIKLLKLKVIKNYQTDKFFSYKFVAYYRKGVENFYNDMYDFLKNDKIPNRLKSEIQIYC